MRLCGSCFLCQELFHCLKCLYKGENGGSSQRIVLPVTCRSANENLWISSSTQSDPFHQCATGWKFKSFSVTSQSLLFYLEGSETRHRAQEWRGGIQRQGQEVVWNRVGTRGGRWFLAEASSSWWREFKPSIAFQSPSGQITWNQPSLPCWKVGENVFGRQWNSCQRAFLCILRGFASLDTHIFCWLIRRNKKITFL